jgi:apolipoprotein N-acyltransferase
MGASALCFALALPLTNWWWLLPLSAASFAVAATGASSQRVLLLSVLLCWGGVWAWVQRWIMEVSAAGFPALVVYLVLWSSAHAVILRRVAGSIGGRVPLAVLLPITWIGLELLRGTVVFDGYPWYFIGHPLAEVPLLAQSADLLGVPLISAIVCVVGGAAADLWLRRVTSPLPRGVLIASVLLLLAANLSYGLFRLAESDRIAGQSPADGPLVLAIQTNLPQSNKVAWTAAQQIADFDAFRALTLAAISSQLELNRVPDVVAWPETMLPGFGLEEETIDLLLHGDWFPGDLFSKGVLELAALVQRPLLLGSGAFDGFREADGQFLWSKRFNSAYLLDPDGTRQRYDKVFLTPFGETMPYISAFPALEARLLDLGARGMRFDLDVGTQVSPLLVVSPRGAWRVSTPICFEDAVSWLCREMAFEPAAETLVERPGQGPRSRWGVVKRADLFVNLTNDGWFGSNDAARVHHAQLARWRCIENRLPMVRSVNTGLSVAIDSSGRLRGAAVGEGYGESRAAGWLASGVLLDPRIPVYAALGDLLGWLAAAATAILLALSLVGFARRRWLLPQASS